MGRRKKYSQRKVLESNLERGGGDNNIIFWCIFLASTESVLLFLNLVELSVCVCLILANQFT